MRGRALQMSIDGRFLGQPLTGVQRYAREWLLALDDLLVAGDPAVESIEVDLVVPRSLVNAAPALERVTVRGVGRVGGHAWEQLVLPGATRGRLLFCPANLAPLASLASPQRVVVTLHGLSFVERPGSYSTGFRLAYRFMAKAALRLADAILTVSETERRALVARVPGARDRVHAIPNGAAPRSFGFRGRRSEAQLRDAAAGRRDLLFVGSLTEGKNLQAAIDALAIIRERHDLGLVVVGAAGPGLAEARVEIPPSCRGHVELVGQVADPDALREHYVNALCLVFPSRYESSGLPPTEAMACGCPVVVSDLPVLRERCRDAALYCDPDDPGTLAARVFELVGDGERTDALRRAGLRRAAELSWEENVRGSIAVMREVASHRR